MAYSDAFRSEALIKLAVNHYDYKKTAKDLGISDRTLRDWEKNYTKNTVPQLLERAIEHILMAIPDNWDGKDWAITVGILLDKYQLLRGEPTSRTESILKSIEGLSDNERDSIIAEAERLLAETAGASAAGGDVAPGTVPGSDVR